MCACKLDTAAPPSVANDASNEPSISIRQIENNTVESRIKAPENFERTIVDPDSYAYYLRNLKLKSQNSDVKYYNGETKKNYNVYCAVIDLKIGKKNLHQCADAIMRLKAEYHWHKKEYEKIHFNFTNGFEVKYTEWMKGNRIKFNGNKTIWAQLTQPSNTYADFWQYLETIFTYAGTASLEKELKPVKKEDIEIGDILIQGGFPGHAITIIDKVKNTNTGESLYLLAQSYMPAQETQILVNPNNKEISPWYKLDSETIITPEWVFNINNLKRFAD